MAQNQQVAIADQRKNFLSVIESGGFKKQLALAAPKHLTPDRILRITLTAFNKNPKLFECDQNTILAAMMDCTSLGLEPDGRKAYLVPYYDSKKRMLVCQLIVGYQGMIELAYRHPQVTGIRARAVYAKDEFEYDEGLQPYLRHKPSDDDDPGPLTHAYAICNIGQHGSTFVVLNRRQVMKAKSKSSSADKGWSPWNEFEEAMWVKTAVRALAKYMPTSTELAEAIQVDDRHNAAVIDLGAVTNLPTGNLGGGAPQSLTDLAQQEQDGGGGGNAGSQGGGSGGGGGNDDEGGAAGAVAGGGGGAPKGPGGNVKKLVKEIEDKGRAINAGKTKLTQTLVEMKMLQEGVTLDSLSVSELTDILGAWEEIKDKILNPNAVS